MNVMDAATNKVMNNDELRLESPDVTFWLRTSSSFEIASFMETLPTSLNRMVNEVAPVLTIPRETVPSAAIRAEQLEIQLRSYLLDLVQAVLATPCDNNVDQREIDLQQAWSWSLLLCAHLVYFSEHQAQQTITADETFKVTRSYQGLSVRKLPVVLLEDILDSLPLDQGQRFWEGAVEPATPVLFGPVMWSQQSASWLPFLKVCNKILRRLKHSHFEDTFISEMQVAQRQPSWAGRILMLLADVFSLSDKSSHKSWGSFRAVPTEYESRDQFQHQQEPARPPPSTNTTPEEIVDSLEDDEDLADPTAPASTSSPSYTLYETFWSLQQDFSNPSSIKVALFIQRMRLVLAALESHPTTTTTASPRPPKYLTSSNLLPIQMGDLDFRIHFLTQFLIVAHHLASESPKLGSTLQELETRAKDLVQRKQPGDFPNRGKEHLQFIEFLLQQREPAWRQWKKNKCLPELEKTLPTTATATPTPTTVAAPLKAAGPSPTDTSVSKAPMRKRKRLSDTSLSDLKTENDDNAMIALEQLARPRSAVQAGDGKGNCISKSPLVPDLEIFLEPYVEALDPDAGIEHEYHPKRNAPYCWKAMRLLGQQHLGLFKMVQRNNGDFERVVRAVYEQRGIEIPGEPPALANDDEHDDEEKPDEAMSVKELQDEAKEDKEAVDMIDAPDEKNEGDTDEAVEVEDEQTAGAMEIDRETPIDAEPYASDHVDEKVEASSILSGTDDKAQVDDGGELRTRQHVEVVIESVEGSKVGTTIESDNRVIDVDAIPVTEEVLLDDKAAEQNDKASRDRDDANEAPRSPRGKSDRSDERSGKVISRSPKDKSDRSIDRSSKQSDDRGRSETERSGTAKHDEDDNKSHSSSSKRNRRRSSPRAKRDESRSREGGSSRDGGDGGGRSHSSGDGDGRVKDQHQRDPQYDRGPSRGGGDGGRRPDFNEGSRLRDPVPSSAPHGRTNFSGNEGDRPAIRGGVHNIPESHHRGAEHEHNSGGGGRRPGPGDDRDGRGGRNVAVPPGPDRGPPHRGGHGPGNVVEENRRAGPPTQAPPSSPPQRQPQDSSGDGGNRQRSHSGSRRSNNSDKRDDHRRRGSREDRGWRR